MGTLLVWAIGIPLALFGGDVPIISQLASMAVDAKGPTIILCSAVGMSLFGLSGATWTLANKFAKMCLGGGIAAFVVGIGGPSLLAPYLITHFSGS